MLAGYAVGKLCRPHSMRIVPTLTPGFALRDTDERIVRPLLMIPEGIYTGLNLRRDGGDLMHHPSVKVFDRLATDEVYSIHTRHPGVEHLPHI